jgi:FkbM family methyltransferase
LHIRDRVCAFNFRKDSIGDQGVIDQIFQKEDYAISHWVQGQRLFEYHAQQSQVCPSLIVDAGANIGASAVYFLNMFDNSFVFAVEPDQSNWEICVANTGTYSNCLNFHGAVSATDGKLAVIDAGQSDWGFRTTPVIDNNKIIVSSISPTTIMKNPAVVGMTPLIFKIDVEGAEQDLFSKSTEWVDQFALIIIELHDWMLPWSGSSKNFLKAIAQYDFDIVYRGENIFLFNRKILS